MLKYICKRLLLMIPTLLGIIFIVFTVMNLTPGSPGRTILGTAATQEQVDQLNHELGYDRPFLVRFFDYCGDLLQGDMGTSYRTRADFTTELKGRMPTTLKLGIASFVFSSILGISLGILSAVKQYSFADTFCSTTAILFASIPGFFLGMVLIYVFGLQLGWFPTFGGTDFKSYVLPVISLAMYPMAYTTRLTKTSMLDALGQDYVRTARAKGVMPYKVIFKHALRNALIPVITYAGPMVAYIITGSMVVETIFSIGGLGSSFVTSINNRDYTLIMGVTLFLAFLMVTANLITDIIYKLVDPRISFD